MSSLYVTAGLAVAGLVLVTVIVCCLSVYKRRAVRAEADDEAAARWVKKVGALDLALQRCFDEALDDARRQIATGDRTAAARSTTGRPGLAATTTSGPVGPQGEGNDGVDSALLVAPPPPAAFEDIRRASREAAMLVGPVELAAEQLFRKLTDVVAAHSPLIIPVPEAGLAQQQVRAPEPSCCLWRCCCICPDTEHTALVAAASALFKDLAAHMPRTGAAPAIDRGWMPADLRDVCGRAFTTVTITEDSADAARQRGLQRLRSDRRYLDVAGGAPEQEEPTEMRPVPDATRLVQQEPAPLDEDGRPYMLRECQYLPSSTGVRQVRRDVALYCASLRAVMYRCPRLDHARRGLWCFDLVTAVDLFFHRILWARRVAVAEHWAQQWRAQAVGDVTSLMEGSLDGGLRVEAVMAGQRLAMRSAKRQGTAAATLSFDDVTPEHIASFAEDHVAAAKRRLRALFEPLTPVLGLGDPGERGDHRLPDYPRVRALATRDGQLEQALGLELEVAAAAEFAVSESELGVATKLLGDAKVAALARLGDEPLDDDAADDARLERAADRYLDEEACCPDVLRERFVGGLDRAREAAVADVAAQVHEAEKRLAVDIVRAHPDFESAFPAAVLGPLREATAAPLRNVAAAVALLKQALRLAEEICLALRQLDGPFVQSGIDTVRRYLGEQRTVLWSLCSDPALQEYQAWVPLDKIYAAFNVAADKVGEDTLIVP